MLNSGPRFIKEETVLPLLAIDVLKALVEIIIALSVLH